MAVCEDQTVEALRQKSGAWIGLMWHPERETPAAHRDLETLRWVFEGDHG
jgi:gamma-glutamyl-gamma-aminobutyrate hydrolase PuuD